MAAKIESEDAQRMKVYSGPATDLRFWEEMIENGSDVPVGFVHWRTNKVRTGMAFYWVQGKKTGFTVCQFSKVTPVETIDDTWMRVDIRFRPGAFITQPKNIVSILNVVPLKLLGGCSTTPFSFENDNCRGYRSSRGRLPGLVTFAVGYDEEPKYSFWTCAGLMNPRNYNGAETSESMFSTFEGYGELMGISNEHDHLIPDSDAGEVLARTRVVCSQAAQLVFTPDNGGSISRLVPGMDPMGYAFDPQAYESLKGIHSNLNGPAGNNLHTPRD
jgi:hypothetical protein